MNVIIKIMNYLITEKIKKEYNLKNPVFLKKFETRGQRRVFLIIDNKNKYVIKIIPNKKELIAKLEFISKIKNKIINFPRIIDTKSNKKYFFQSGNFFFLSEFIDEKENMPSLNFFSKLGYAVGEFHKIETENSKILNLNIGEKIKKLKTLFSKKNIDIKIKNQIINFLDSFPPISGATIGPVHGDISYFNVLGKEKLFLIDFDDISRGPIVYDLGQMVAFMFNLIPFDFLKFEMKIKRISQPVFLMSGFKIFLKNYSRKIKLSRHDIEILPKMAMLVCLENVYLESIDGIFKWNFKRFKKIEKEQDLIKQLSLKYFLN
ncbi:phosphotransferase [Candidatus Wolfebacteria bacterium]|nr:phosphotransferase [Candidatus Wolfebacteria bacterium]